MNTERAGTGERRVYEFAVAKEPAVSIVTLLYNKANLTEQFLLSLLDNVSIPFQLILLDNASSDSTPELLDRVRGAVVLRSSENLQFIRGNNLAAMAAVGRHLLFLNNDTVVHPGCIESMALTLDQRSEVAGVAAKIVLPGGMLQEAGSIIWKDGSCYGYGRGDDPARPEFNYRREVDYGSAACLMVRREKFLELGGFDNRYAPAYYEDTDLCMKLRQAGGSIVYVPQAVITHHEYASSSPEAAVAKMQQRQAIFREKWPEQLATQQEPELGNALRARDRRPLKTMLYVDDRIPTPDEGSGWPRAFGFLEILSKLYKITVFPKQDSKPREPWTSRLQQMGVECMYGDLSFADFIQQRSGYYDVVFASRPHNFEQIFREGGEHLAGAKVVYDAEALFYARERIKRQLRGMAEDEEFREVARKELGLADGADAVILVSEGEKQVLLGEREALGMPAYERIEVIGHGISAAPGPEDFEQRQDLLFVGAFHGNDTPNEDAVLYFLDDIFPLVREKLDCRIVIAGPNPPAALVARASDHVKVLGFVPDVMELYERARVFIVPNRFAGGVAWKLSETMAAGLPSVCTPLMARQFGLQSEEESPMLLGGDAREFAAKVVALYSDAQLWRRRRAAGLDYIARTHSPAELSARLLAVMGRLWESAE